MPELPEVETIRRDLAPYLVHSTVQVAWYKPGSPVLEMLPYPDIAFSDREIWQVRRAGKILLLEFAPWADSMGMASKEQGKSKPRLMAFSLGMTGQLFRTQDFPLQEVLESYNHLHLVLRVEESGFTDSFIAFRDPRKFGKIFAVNWQKGADEFDHPRLQGLGPDATEIKAEQLIALAGESKRNLKKVLMDQSVVAGIGNIYASEILFRSGMHPETEARGLTARHWEDLSQNIQAVIEEAIENRGSTISDYVSGEGKPGSAQRLHRVYGREGKECTNEGCTAKIRKITIAGRSTFFCPHCQRGLHHGISREEKGKDSEPL